MAEDSTRLILAAALRRVFMTLQVLQTRFDVFQLNAFHRVVHDAFGSPNANGGRRIRVHHDFQESRYCGRSALLKPSDGLRVSVAACFPVSCLELWQLKPAP